jgi:hypothetical protein
LSFRMPFGAEESASCGPRKQPCNPSFVHTFASHFGKRTGRHFSASWGSWAKQDSQPRTRGRSSF